MAQNTFSDVVNQVQQSPQNQRTERLIDGIAQQMQQSGNPLECLCCGGPLSGREGEFVLKYFLIEPPRRRA